MKLHTEIRGSGPVIVLLHGMAGSSRFWSCFMDIADSGYSCISIDLAGFGRSSKPSDCIYDYDTHVGSIVESIQAAGVTRPFILIGHSMGGLLALRLAADYPELIAQVIICGLPYYPDRQTARRAITRDKLAWRLAFYGRTSHALCTVWCSWLNPITRWIAPLYLPHMPRTVAQDTLLHTWKAYAESLNHVVEDQDISRDLARINCQVTLLYGQKDYSLQLLKSSKITEQYQNIIGVSYPGLTHQLPLESPRSIFEILTMHQG